MLINIYFSHQMVDIGKTHNLWYEIIEEMENVCNYFDHTKKDVSLYKLKFILYFL